MRTRTFYCGRTTLCFFPPKEWRHWGLQKDLVEYAICSSLGLGPLLLIEWDDW